MLKKETNLASEPSVQHTNCCLTLLWSASAIMHPVEMLLHKIYTLRYIALLYSTCLLTAMGCYALNILMSSAWVSEHKRHCINVIGNMYHILLCPFFGGVVRIILATTISQRQCLWHSKAPYMCMASYVSGTSLASEPSVQHTNCCVALHMEHICCYAPCGDVSTQDLYH